ncbi:ABC transporter substrate-binding protein [Antribacter gilvus]|uniref:ABC transporter substrate-binding protein n=1 Tax=Antribacter gilvus TaxID=2304675 RepID=UPI000F78A97C|nr:sugar ABC transporter substrate-binding protein [Antribacter gilvus]
MKKSRLAAGMVAAIALSTTLAACGAGSNTDDDGKLTFMFRGGEDEKAAYEEAISRFEEETGVTVDVVVTDADQYATKLQAAIAGNNVPDVFYIEQASLQSYVTSGILLDITDHVAEQDVDLDNMWEYGVNSYRYDGKLQGTPEGRMYGLPKDVGPFAMGYNKTMLEAEGIPLPSVDEPYTWDQWLEVLKATTKDTDGDGEVDQWGTGLNVQWNSQGFAWSNGADWTNEDHTEVTVDTPEMAEALQYIADLSNVHKVTPNAEQAATLDTYQRWMAGELAFFPVGPWDVSVYNELDFEYDLIPFPAGSTGEPATWIGSLGIGASATTAMPEEAVQLVTYLSADETAQTTLVEAGIQVPNLKDMAAEWAAEEGAEPANRQEFLDVVEDYGRPMPAAFTYGAAWYDELWTNIQPVIDGQQPAAEYLAEVQPRMQALLDEANAAAEQAAAANASDS